MDDERLMRQVRERWSEATPRPRFEGPAVLRAVRRRRLMTRTVPMVAASTVVLGAVLAALTVTLQPEKGAREMSSPSSSTSPPPQSCEPATRFGASHATKVASSDSASEAVQPWTLEGEEVQLLSEDRRYTHVLMGPADGEPRLELRLDNETESWFVSEVKVCARQDVDMATCGESLTYQSTQYMRGNDDREQPGAGRPLGLVEMSGCGAPVLVTGYAANEEDPRYSVVVTVDGTPAIYKSS